MYTVENCSHIVCKNCLFFGKSCKRISGTSLEFAKPWFVCQDTGFHLPCSAFEPKHPEYADMKEWTNFADFWNVYKEAWFTPSDKYIPFTIHGDHSVRYYVPVEKFIDGTMIENGKLMAEYKQYYKKARNEIGYKLVREEVNAVEL